MRGLCDVCVSPGGQIRCKCRYTDMNGSYPSTICNKCWKEHICITLWMKIRIRIAKQFNLICPYNGTAYRKLPGYVSAYGCPVCKATGPSHIQMR